MPPRRVVIVCFPGVQSLDVCGPLEVFAGATRWLREGGSGKHGCGHGTCSCEFLHVGIPSGQWLTTPDMVACRRYNFKLIRTQRIP